MESSGVGPEIGIAATDERCEDRYGRGTSEKGRKFRGAIALGLLAVPALAVTPAHAASTRAEYIAQVDPICQSFVGPETVAYKAYRRNAKRWDHLSGPAGTVKAWLNATRRTSKSLTRLTQIDVSLIEQIAAVPPPAADAGTVGTWLNDRRQSDAFAASAAAALNRPVPQIGKYFKRVKQANASMDAEQRAIDGFRRSGLRGKRLGECAKRALPPI